MVHSLLTLRSRSSDVIIVIEILKFEQANKKTHRVTLFRYFVVKHRYQF